MHSLSNYSKISWWTIPSSSSLKLCSIPIISWMWNVISIASFICWSYQCVSTTSDRIRFDSEWWKNAQFISSKRDISTCWKSISQRLFRSSIAQYCLSSHVRIVFKERIITNSWIKNLPIEFKFRFNWISLHINHCAKFTLQQSILCKVKI